MKIIRVELALPFHPVEGYSANDGKPSEITVTAEAIFEIAKQIKPDDTITFGWEAYHQPPKYEIYIERKEDEN